MNRFWNASLRLAAIVLWVLAVGAMASRGAAQEEKPKVKSKAPAAKPPAGKVAKPKADPKNPLVAKIEKLVAAQRTIKDPKGFEKNIDELLATCDALLDGKPSSDDEAVGIRNKLAGLWGRVRLEKEGAMGDLRDYSRRFFKDERPAVGIDARAFNMMSRVMSLTPKSTDAAEVAADLAKVIETDPLAIPLDTVRHLMVFLLETNATEDAKQALRGFVDALGKRKDDAEAQAVAEQLQKMLAKLELIGKPIEVAGTNANGQEFDWAAYKGKVVLIDFWSARYRPYLDELKNIRAVYEKYHERGFEVVGVCLDNDREELTSFLSKEQIPWTVLFEEVQTKDKPNPLAEKYGIEAPVSILVGRDGAAVAFGASGEGLGDFVAAQLDPKSDKAGEKKKEDEKEAADEEEGEPGPDPKAKAESEADERKTDGDDEAADRASEDESQDD